ncbi:hypothetical protein J5I95_23225 [Candidatus Poribacteria bacterium]|nr:hypothetical protein [Candidatus Poribacteria bacterium]
MLKQGNYAVLLILLIVAFILMVFTLNTLDADSHNPMYRVSRILSSPDGMSIAISPDGKILASGNFDDIHLWDIETGKKKHTLKSHSDRIRQLVFSPDGETLASGGGDKTIRLWDVNTGELKEWFEGHTDEVRTLVFTPDGETLVSGSQDNTIRLWNVGKIPLFNIESKNIEQPLTLTNHSKTVIDLAFTPNGQRFASGSFDGTIRLWDINERILVDSKNTYDVRTVTQDSILSDNKDGESVVRCVVFSPDGYTLASGGIDIENGDIDGTIRLWNINSINADIIKHTLTGHTDRIWYIVFSPDGYTLASCSFDKTVRLWDVETGTLKHTLKGHKDTVRHIAFTVDGQTLASASDDSTIRLWNVETGTHYATLTGHRRGVYNLIFSNDGKTLVSQDSNDIRLWKLKD